MLTRDQILNLTSREYSKTRRALLCFILLAAASHVVFRSTGSTEASPTRTDFRSGAEVTEQLPAKSEKEFLIFLNKGEVLQFEVVKGDLNISVDVYDPGGRRQLIEYVSYSYESVELSAVADATGVFVIKIRSLETTSRQDQVALTVQPIRRATANDIKNAAARFAIATATRFASDWTEDSFRKAIDNYVKASVMATDSRIKSVALRKAGETYLTLGEYSQALDSFKKAAVLSEQSGAKQDALHATAQAACLHSLLGNNGKAQLELNRVFSFYSDRNVQYESTDFKHAYAQALICQGDVFYSKGDLLGSSDFLERARKLFEETVDRNGQARSLLLAGHVANLLGSDRAMTNFNQAYELYHQVGNRSGEGLSITGEGITHTLKGKHEEGIKLHREARAIFQKIGDRQSEAITLTAIGQAYQKLSKNELALNHYKEGTKLLQNSGTIELLLPPIYQIGLIYRDMKELETALTYLKDCARLSHASKKRRMEAYALDEIASIYAEQGKQTQALNQYFKVLRLHSTGDLRGQALTLNNIGDVYLSWGRKREALAVYKQALPLSEKAGERGIQMTTLYNITRAMRDNGSLDEAKSYIEQLIKVSETLRTNVASPDFRSSFFSGFRKYYELYIDILWQLDRHRPGQGFAGQALIASEGSRARAFVELLAEAGADIRQGVDPALLKRERELQSLLAAHARYQMEAAASSEPKHDQAELNKQLDKLKAEYEELQAQVRNQSARYQTLVRPTPLTIAEIQAQLRTDDLLLEYSLGEERSYLWAVTPTSVNVYELKPRSVLEPAALEFYKLLTARQETGSGINNNYHARVEEADKLYGEKAHELSRMLLEQVSGELGKKRLLLVTEGVLQYIPFDALPRPTAPLPDTKSVSPGSNFGDSYLIVDHEIVRLPSVSALAAIRAESNRVTPRRGVVAVFADPVFNGHDERVQAQVKTEVAATLPAFNQPALRGFSGVTERGGLRRLTYSSDEADSILAAASGAAWVLKGFEASRENVMADKIGEYQIVHFATHGFVNTERPELSALVLTMINPDGTSADGFLQLHDIFNLKLSAELTVLSACETGLGKDVRGEGLIGLTRGLMFAGSRSVVASLWKVDDRATAVLMGHFYKALLQDRMPRAAALRYAKQQLRKEPAWASPYFWAGFVLQGEYDKPIAVEQQPPIPRSIVVLLVVAGIIACLLTLKSIYRTNKINPDRS